MTVVILFLQGGMTYLLNVPGAIALTSMPGDHLTLMIMPLLVPSGWLSFWLGLVLSLG